MCIKTSGIQVCDVIDRAVSKTKGDFIECIRTFNSENTFYISVYCIFKGLIYLLPHINKTIFSHISLSDNVTV